MSMLKIREIKKAHRDELGITNLGLIPEGMGIYDAVVFMKDQRKYIINPENHSFRITICETIREIYRETERKKPNMERIKELAAAAFDFGKRMDYRMKELKNMIDDGETFE